VRLAPAPRLPQAPRWVLPAFLAWCALVGGEALLERYWGIPTATCLFKAVTGQPCPTCGTTRGFLAILTGHPLRALAWNPLFFTVLAAVVAWLAFRAATGLILKLDWDKKSRRIALVTAIVLVLTNWAYLIYRGI
jgi:hypothetical protein